MQVIIEGLVAIQSERLKCQENFSKQYKEMWAKSQQTVHLNYGRMTGKTTTIAKMATQYDLVIVPNTPIKNILLSYGCKATILTAKEANGLLPQEYGYVQRVFVDEPSLVFYDFPKDKMYYLLAHGNIEQRFILLGE